MSEYLIVTTEPADLLVCSGNTNTIEHVDPTTDTASTVANTSAIRYGGYSVSSQTYTWLAGGSSTGTSVERLDNATYVSAVTASADLVTPIASGACASGETEGFFIGSTWGDAVFSFDLSSETVSASTTLPTRVSRPSATQDNSFIYCTGGTDTSGVTTNLVQVLDISSVTWTSYNILLGGRSNHASSLKGTTIWAAGGLSTAGLRSDISALNTDVTVSYVGFRSYLTQTRRDFVALSNSSYCWWAGGYSPPGPLSIIDRTNLANDTTDSIYRCSLSAGKYSALRAGDFAPVYNILANSDIICMVSAATTMYKDLRGMIGQAGGFDALMGASRAYICGGQNYTTVYTDIVKLTYADDTEVVVNSSLSARYSGSSLCDTDYTWYAGGRTADGQLADVIERLDHASETTNVVSSSMGHTFAEAGSISTNGGCRVKAGEVLYNFDTASETWSVSACYGTDIFISGSGMENTGVFAGGITGSVRSDSISLLDLPDDTLYTVPARLSAARSGVSSGSIAETTWFFGGVNLSYTGTVESYNHLSMSAPLVSRASLPTSKSKCGVATFATKMYILGGYRGYALPEIDSFDPYSDTASIISRTSGNIVRHSFGTSTNLIYDNRALALLNCTLNSTVSTDLMCSIRSVRTSDTTVCMIAPPAGTIYRDVVGQLNVTPVEYGVSRKAICAPSGLLHVSDVGCQMAITVSDICTCYIPGAADLASNIVCETHSSVDNLIRPFILDAPIWSGGGPGINAFEKFDISTETWATRGASLYPRGGAASATASDEAWIGGGSTTSNIVEHLSYTTDTLTLDDRTDLSVARSYLVAASDSNYCWYIGGASSAGLTGIVDRLDKSNDVLPAIYRCADRPRMKAAGDVSGPSIVVLGGQVGTDIKGWVSVLDPSIDTVVYMSADMYMPLMDHCCINDHDTNIAIQHGAHIYDFDLTRNMQVVLNDAPYYTSARSYKSGDSVIVTGGVNGTIKSSRTTIYDWISRTLDASMAMYFDRYNHWMAGPATSLDNGSMTVNGLFSSVENYGANRQATCLAVSADSSIQCMSESADTVYSDMNCIYAVPEGCTYSSLCDYMWVLGSAGNIWRLSYASTYSNVTYAGPNSRSCGASSSTEGHIFGGVNNSIDKLNYSTSTLSGLPVGTDTECESSSALSCLSHIKVLNGCEYTGEYIPISSRYRSFDRSTETLVDVSSSLDSCCRACAIRSLEGTGYLLGGTNIQNDLSANIRVINTDADTVSYSANTLTIPFDLLASFATSYGSHILTDGSSFDPSSELCTAPTIAWPTLYGASCGTESSDALIIGGSVDRIDGTLVGTVIPGELNHHIYKYDQHSDTLVTGVSDFSADLFEGPMMHTYEMCSPLARVVSDLSCLSYAMGTRVSYVVTEVKKDYTYTDTICEVRDCVDTGMSTLNVIYDAYESSLLACRTSSIDTLASAKACYCHYSVLNYTSDLPIVSAAIDMQATELAVWSPAEQLMSTVTSIAYLPNFGTYSTVRACSLYIGGEISTRRCSIGAVASAKWSLEMSVPELILLSKSTESGDLLEILHKLVRDGNTTKTVSEIFSSVSAAFGNENFIYSIDHSRGVRASEGTLIIPGGRIQILRLAIRLSGANMWISNRQGKKFYISCSKDYIGDGGMVYMPISGNIMILSLKLAEPMSSAMTFDFRTSGGSATMQLIPV